MNTKTLPQSTVTTRWLNAGLTLDRFCKRQLSKKLNQLKEGYLEIFDLSAGAQENGQPYAQSYAQTFGSPESPLKARVLIRRSSAFSRIALGGTIGTGESYVDGDWECEQLTQLVQIFALNRELLLDMDNGMGALLQPLQSFAHRLRRNSIQGSQQNIHAHYDVGNDFFALFLDPTWMYSCGIFENDQSTLQEASIEKNNRICQKLGLTSRDHLLEIGTGWGGFAIHAAKNFGCRVTTTTISKEQFELAKKRVQEEGLSDKITLLFEDYRKLEGQYDKLVSIEMIEAVGLKYLDTYFDKCSSLLKADGAMLLQSIIIRDQYFEQAKHSVDFIQTHIFPGAGIPSVLSIADSVARKTDMRLFHQEDLTPHYAKTLNLWSKSLKEKEDQIVALGYPAHLSKLWQYYFSYCEGGFLERSIGCVQMVFEKPRSRKTPVFWRLS